MDTKRIDALLSESQWLYGLAQRLVSTDQADDVVQETMLSALQSPPPVERPLRPWLARVARNVVRMGYRGDKRRAARELYFSDEESTQGSPESLDRFSVQRMLAEHLDDLPEPYRSTLLSRYYDDKSSFEIAKELDIPDSTVRWRIKQGIELLRNRLEVQKGPRWRVALLPFLPIGPASSAGVAGGLTQGSMMMILAKAAIVVLLLGAISAGTWVLWPERADQSVAAADQSEPAPEEAEGTRDPVAAEPTPTRPLDRRRSLLADLKRTHPKSGGKSEPAIPVPEARVLGIEDMSELDLAYLHDQFDGFLPLLKECYDNARAQHPGLAGIVMLEISVIADEELGGLVEEARVDPEDSTIANDELNECLTQTLYALVLDPPRTGGRAIYRSPLRFAAEKPARSSEKSVRRKRIIREITKLNFFQESLPPQAEKNEAEALAEELAEAEDRDGLCGAVTCLVRPELACCIEKFGERSQGQ